MSEQRGCYSPTEPLDFANLPKAQPLAQSGADVTLSKDAEAHHEPGGRGAVRRHPEPIGVGMPAWLWLCDFGAMVLLAWGKVPYLVGSALEKRDPRDIDVRLVLSDEAWERYLGEQGQANFAGTGWAAHCQAWSALGAQMTGLPVDFQIQHWLPADVRYRDRPRLPIAHFPGSPSPKAMAEGT
jgi:hypothetical protein